MYSYAGPDNFRIADEVEFKTEFWNVRRGVEAAAVVARREVISTTNITGMRISRKMAFIHREEWARLGGGEPGSSSCSAQVVQMPTYEGGSVGVIEGTVCELSALPEGAAHEVIELFMQSGRIHDVELLSPAMTFRRGQPGERFQVAVNNMLGDVATTTKQNKKRQEKERKENTRNIKHNK